MEEIQKQVARARQRLVLRQWASRVGLCLTLGLSIALVAILLPKAIVLPPLPTWWAWAWLGGGAGLGLLAATVWTYAQSRTPIEAAVEIDQRYDLRERIASALSLREEDLETEAGAAVARDAERAIRLVEVTERFPLDLNAHVLRPLAPAVLGLLAAALLPNREADASLEPPPVETVAIDEAKKVAEKTRKELAKKRKRAEEAGLKDATALLKKIEEGTAKLAEKAPKDITKTAVKLNDLAKELRERKQKLGGGKQLREQLNRMKGLNRGPADKAAEAMQKGDWKQAAKEFQKLREQIAGGKATKEQQEALKKQLQQMQQKLADATQKQEAQKQELKRQLEEAQRKGDLNQAGKLQQKLDQMAQQQKQQQQMQQMAQQMQQAAEALQQGKPQQAADAMDKMAQQMQQMQMEAAEMEMLDGAMTDIQAAKQGMGMQPGQGMPGAGQMGRGRGGQKGQPGPGMGEGQGAGERPDEEHDVNFRDSKVKQNVGRGASTFGGLVEGPSIKGEVAEQIKTPLSAESATPADPLTSERLPRSRREHAEDYFKGLRERL